MMLSHLDGLHSIKSIFKEMVMAFIKEQSQNFSAGAEQIHEEYWSG
jgi:hypothetical protein